MSRTPLDATTAYYKTVPGATTLRIVFGVLRRLWPALAVRAAVRLFLTPLPPKWLARGKRWDGWKVTRWRFEQAGVTLYEQFGDGPVVLLAHGWGGHGGQMLALAGALARTGLHPIIMEMPAHGHSAGLDSSLPQFARTIDYAVARLAAEGRAVHTLVAHSLGATAAAYAASRGLPVERLVLVAPAASPVNYTRMFAHIFNVGEQVRAAMQAHIQAREGALMVNFEPSMVGARIGVPALVVHDRKDTINPFSDGEAFAAAIPGARLLASAGLGHRAVLKDAEVVAGIVDFVAPAQDAPDRKRA